MARRAGLSDVNIFSEQKDTWNSDYTQKFFALNIRDMTMSGMKGSADTMWRLPPLHPPQPMADMTNLSQHSSLLSSDLAYTAL